MNITMQVDFTSVVVPSGAMDFVCSVCRIVVAGGTEGVHADRVHHADFYSVDGLAVPVSGKPRYKFIAQVTARGGQSLMYCLTCLKANRVDPYYVVEQAFTTIQGNATCPKHYAEWITNAEG